MKSNYKRLGPYIKEVNVRNTGNFVKKLLGVSNEKIFIPSIANIHGTDLSKYKVIKKNQFAFGPVTSRNGDKISIALLDEEIAIVSTSYITFEIVNHDELLPEYLMLWFKRTEFDRYARYKSHGSVREIFDWEQMCNVTLPIPSIKKQHEFIRNIETLRNAENHYQNLNDLLEDILVSFSNKLINNDYDNLDLLSVFKVEYGKGMISKSKDGKYPVYGAGGITGYKNSYDHEKSKIIVGCRGTCGKKTLTLPKSTITPNSLIFEPIYKNYDIGVYYSFLSLFNFDETITGSVQNQITINSLKDRPFVFPKNINEKESKVLNLITILLIEINNIRTRLQKIKENAVATIVKL